MKSKKVGVVLLILFAGIVFAVSEANLSFAQDPEKSEKSAYSAEVESLRKQIDSMREDSPLVYCENSTKTETAPGEIISQSLKLSSPARSLTITSMTSMIINDVPHLCASILRTR